MMIYLTFAKWYLQSVSGSDKICGPLLIRFQHYAEKYDY